MAKKTHDLVVKTGSYQSNGETKNRYKNVGLVMTNDDGGRFILLDRTFNPAGVPNPDNQETVLISIFAVKDKEEGGNNAGHNSNESDDLPF